VAVDDAGAQTGFSRKQTVKQTPNDTGTHPRSPEIPSAADDFKRFFSRGLAALLPTLLTVVVLIWAYELIDQHVGRHITRGMVLLFAAAGPPQIINVEKDPLAYGTPIDEWNERGQRLTQQYKIVRVTQPLLEAEPQKVEPEARKAAERARNVALWEIAFARYKLHLIGFLIAVILIYFVGLFLASFLGRTTWRLIEGALYRIPLIRAIYPNIKQVTDFLLRERTLQFSGVVAVQYPRKGIWSVGLVTSRPMKTLQNTAGDELMTVFIPSSPTPVTGYTITVAKRDVVELGLSLDEALRYTISGGVIKPNREMLAEEVQEALALD